MTEPTKMFAHIQMQALLHAWQRIPTGSSDSKKGDDTVRDRLYTAADIQECMRRIQTVSYEQWVWLGPHSRLQALSSGMGLGASNWMVEMDGRRIFMLGPSSLVSGRLAATFGFPHDPVDLVISTGCLNTSEVSYTEQMKVLADEMKVVLNQRHAVLLPSAPHPEVVNVLLQLHRHIQVGPGFLMFI